MLTHDKEYGIMKENALSYIERYYKWDVIMTKFRKIIDSVCDGAKE